jgi:thioredoxin-related protein
MNPIDCQQLMKFFLRYFIGIAILFFVHAASAQEETHFDENGSKAVFARAKAEHKPVFYLIYATWCPHCNKMKSEVFKDPAVAAFLNANFICASQDIEKGEGDYFKKKFKVNAFPTFLVFDQKSVLLYHFNGEYKSDAFVAEIKNALIPEKQLPYLAQQFEDNPGNAQKCLDFLVALKKGYERTELNPSAQKYLATQTDSQLVSEINWRIIANGVNDIESRPFQYVLRHQEAFAAVSSPKRVQKKIVNIVTELLEPYLEKPDTTGYFQKRPIAVSVKLQKTDSLIFRYDLAIAEKSKNWKAYNRTVSGSAEKFVWNDAKLLKDIAQHYLQQFTDIPTLQSAVRIAEHSSALNDSYETGIILAKLYQKTNDYKSAFTVAEKARKRNADLGFNTHEADELLAELASNKTQ